MNFAVSLMAPCKIKMYTNIKILFYPQTLSSGAHFNEPVWLMCNCLRVGGGVSMTLIDGVCVCEFVCVRRLYLQAALLLRQVIIRRGPELGRVELEVCLRQRAQQCLQLRQVLLETHTHAQGHTTGGSQTHTKKQ